MLDFTEWDLDLCLSEARTNKLYCTACERKIKKGETVVFSLLVSNRGDKKMDACYCTKCKEGQEYVKDCYLDLAEAEAFGIGQY